MDLESSIVATLIDKGIKVETIIEKCHRVDKNRDGIIHVNDFVKALNQLLGIYTLTRKQMKYIISNIACENNPDLVEFELLNSVIDTRGHLELQPEEHWDVEEPTHSTFNGTNFNGTDRMLVQDTRIARRHVGGSLGRWIQEQACPSEIDNLQLFSALLERYERESGFSIRTDENNNLVVPLGPDLQATVIYGLRP